MQVAVADRVSYGPKPGRARRPRLTRTAIREQPASYRGGESEIVVALVDRDDRVEGYGWSGRPRVFFNVPREGGGFSGGGFSGGGFGGGGGGSW